MDQQLADHASQLSVTTPIAHQHQQQINQTSNAPSPKGTIASNNDCPNIMRSASNDLIDDEISNSSSNEDLEDDGNDLCDNDEADGKNVYAWMKRGSGAQGSYSLLFIGFQIE